MSNICCVLQLAKELISNIKNQQSISAVLHWLVYIAQRIFNVHLGYRFKWGVKGPYSRGLAKDLRAGSTHEKCVCEENLKLTNIKEFLEDLKSVNIKLELALEIAASYIMLRYDVYPKPADPLEELLKKKPYITLRDAQAVTRVLNKYLLSLRERA
mgnify:CR=1 FL=1